MKDAWILTFTGRRFYPFSPRSEDVCLEDIAHALSMKCRYQGHTRWFYSVAEHSVGVMLGAKQAGAQLPEQLQALLHDAAEAYLPDVPSPVKPHLNGFKEVELRVEDAIAEALGLLTLHKTPLITEMDERIRIDEAQTLMPNMEGWSLHPNGGFGYFIRGYDPPRAEMLFLTAYRELQGKLKALGARGVQVQ